MKIWRRKKAKAKGPDPSQILPPEGVPIRLDVAGVGVRMGAQLTDILITTIAVIAVMFFLSALDIVAPQTLGVVANLLFFAIRIPYYILSELAWNGQTLGKRLMKIKVVSHDGGSLTTHGLVLRNLMKEAEIFLPGTLLLSLNASSPIASLIAVAWIVMAFTIPLSNRHRRRLGDYLAGTHVVHLPDPILLKDLSAEAPTPRKRKEKFTFLAHQLDHYGAFELQTLETVLRAEDRTVSETGAANRAATLEAIVEKIREKIGYADPVAEEDRGAFLKAFYSAQRAHLEQRQLFGDRRADKHHREKEETAPP
ncbi:MAG: RDD family protein [Pseudomonadota bacterium]